MDLGGFMQALADAVGWVIAHGQLLAGVIVALIILVYLLSRRGAN
ncbi:MAG TPA: hypothetical protein VGN89_01570 [Phenylobacterium sp.]|nr:hypothetical protein [Phenylobacterium sp.]